MAARSGDRESSASDAAYRIDDLRARIDATDAQILALLNERAQYSLDVRSAKRELGLGLYDAAREMEIIDTLCKENDGPLYDDNVRTIFHAILKVMKELPDGE